MLLDDLGKYLEDQEIGMIGKDIFLGALPSTAQADCVLLSEYAGAGAVRSSAGVAAELPRLQVVVRDAEYQEARETAEAIYQLLDGVANQDINGIRYYWIEALAPPSLLSSGNIDGGERFRIVTNFTIMKERG